jgi:hypothetical protein
MKQSYLGLVILLMSCFQSNVAHSYNPLKEAVCPLTEEENKICFPYNSMPITQYSLAPFDEFTAELCSVHKRGTKSEVFCWNSGYDFGKSSYSLGNLVLKDPTEIVVLQFTTGSNLPDLCALEAGDVSCTLRGVGPLKNPRNLKAWADGFCAVEDGGLHCWPTGYQTEFRTSLVPTYYSINRGAFCTIEGGKAGCYSFSSFSKSDPPTPNADAPALQNPRYVSAVGSTACSIDDVGVHCWNWSDPNGKFEAPPQLNRPTEVVSNGGTFCAAVANGVQCWLDPNPFFNHVGTWLRPAKNPRQLQMSNKTVCFMSDDGLVCQSLDKWWGIPLPRVSVAKLREIQKASTVARSDFMEPILRLKEKNSLNQISAEYYLLYALLSPAVFSSDAEIFVKTYIPEVHHFLDYQDEALDYLNFADGLSKIPDIAMTRTIALEAVRSSLYVSLSYLAISQQAACRDAIQASDVAISDSMDNVKMKILIQKIDALTNEKQILKSSEKSAFLVDTLELATNWLRQKVK